MPRQQTLESLIDWSYDLLSRGEKELFQTLSVFVGGFTFEAAEAVCGAEVLDLLAQLVNKSLVQFEEDQERYRMLETMRQYARVKLLQDGDVEDARDRHLRYFHEYTRGADEGMQGSDVMRWMQCLIADQDNIRAALEWALDRNPQLALQMCNELTFFWIRRGFSHEAQHWLSEAFQRSEDLLTQAGNELRQSKIDRARGLFSLGQVFTAMGDYPSSQEALVQSIDLWREIREPAGLSRSLGMLGVAKIFTGEWEEAQKSANEGLAIGRQVDDDYGIGLSLSSLGQGAIRIEGNPDKALFYTQEALVRLRKRGNDWIFSTVLMGLGLAAFYQGQVATSRAHLTEALEIFQRFGDRQFSNITRSGLADLARLEKNASRAVELYLETLAEWRDMGNRGAIARCLECLAFVAGDLAQADEIDRQKHLQTAGRLLGAAQSLRESSHTKMILEEVAEYERNVTALHQLSQGNTFQLTLVEGNTLSVDQAIALASKMLED